MGSNYGQLFRVSNLRESTGGALGVIVDGICPHRLQPGFWRPFRRELDRRIHGPKQITQRPARRTTGRAPQRPARWVNRDAYCDAGAPNKGSTSRRLTSDMAVAFRPPMRCDVPKVRQSSRSGGGTGLQRRGRTDRARVGAPRGGSPSSWPRRDDQAAR